MGKKYPVQVPGTRFISVRTSKYFHQMSDGQVKKYGSRLYFLECLDPLNHSSMGVIKPDIHYQRLTNIIQCILVLCVAYI